MSETTSLSDNVCEDGIIENISDNTIEIESVSSDYSDSDNVFANAYNINKEGEIDEHNQFYDSEQNDDYFNNGLIDNKSDSDNSIGSQNSKKNINIIIPNKEQQDIINCMKEGNNIIVNAVAGSGKSTTILSAVKQLKDKRFILLTYNRDLASELNQKLKEEWWSEINRSERVEIKTYHSYGKYYLDICKNDLDIIKICKDKIPLKPSLINIKNKQHYIHYIVIDEVQDMTIDLFTFVRKFIIDIDSQQGFRPNLVLIGDVYQSVYSFNGAESRFLEEPRLWEELYDGFIFKTLKVSFRVPYNVAKYINEDVLGEQRIISYDQDSSKPSCFQYVVNMFKDQEHKRNGSYNPISSKINTFIKTKPSNIKDIIDYSVKDYNSIITKHRENKTNKNKPPILDILDSNFLSMCSICFTLINRWIEIEGNNYEDIFILSPTIRTKDQQTNLSDNTTKKSNLKPINILQHFITDTLAKLIRSRYPLYIPNSDNDIITSDDVKGRIAITTFHQSKGRERKFVIIIGYDQSYFTFYNRRDCLYECPPALYVALTRAKKELHLLSNYKHCVFEELKFLRKSCLHPSNYINVIDELSINNIINNSINNISNNQSLLMSELKFKSSELINKEIYGGIKAFYAKDQSINTNNINITIINKFDDVNNELTEFIGNTKNISCRVMNENERDDINKKKIEIEKHYSVTDLNRFVRNTIMYKINNLTNKIMTKQTKTMKLIEVGTRINYQSIQGSTLTDNISNYNSMCLTSIFEQTIIKKESSIITYLRKELNDKKYSVMLSNTSKTTSEHVYSLLNKILEDHDSHLNLSYNQHEKLDNINSLFMAAVLYESMTSYYTHKLHIVHDHYKYNSKHTYIGKETARLACKNIKENLFSKDVSENINEYESERIIKTLFIMDGKYYVIEGRIDLIDEDGVYELKCVSEITPEHKIQLCVYAWLWMINYPTDTRKFRLINIKDGSKLDIATGSTEPDRKTTFKYLNKIVNLLLENKDKSDINVIEPIDSLIKTCIAETRLLLKDAKK